MKDNKIKVDPRFEWADNKEFRGEFLKWFYIFSAVVFTSLAVVTALLISMIR